MQLKRAYSLLLLVPLGTTAMGGGAIADAATRGTEGLVPLRIDVENRSDAVVACGAAVAHWFSVDLATAAPGAATAIALWRDPSSGAVFTLNEHQDRLPVERLWCGFAGRAWATRFEVALPRRAGAAADVALACARDGERLDCR